MRMLSDLVKQQLQDGVIHPYSTHHYEIIDAFRQGDSAEAARKMVLDIKATQALLQAMCND